MNMQTHYLGLELKNPLIVSSCRLSEKIENIKQMEAAGAAAVIMYSIFEEEINYDNEFIDYYMHYGMESFPEALTYFPNIDKQKSFLNQHLYHLRQAVKAVNIPIIASLNATTQKGWIDYVIKMQETGVSALELNLYRLPLHAQSAREIEDEYISVIKLVKSVLHIPLSVKLSPFFTALPDIVQNLEQIGVEGVVLFNRFYYPDINIQTLAFKNDIQLSNSYEMLLPLRWIAILHDKVKLSLAAATGVNSAEDFIKYLLVGADVVMCASCLMKYGIEYLRVLLGGLENWMQSKNCQSIADLHNLLVKNEALNFNEFERVQYMKALRNFKGQEFTY